MIKKISPAAWRHIYLNGHGCNPPSALTKNQQVSATSRFPPEPKIKHLEGSDGSIVRDPPQIKRLGRGRRVAPNGHYTFRGTGPIIDLDAIVAGLNLS